MFDEKPRTENFDDEQGSPEAKSKLRYLAGRGLGRLIDRPNIGKKRRGRRGRRGLNELEIPTGGVAGSRKPTGSRIDVDGDGWADEGTTKPVWVGLPKPKISNVPKVVKNPEFTKNNYNTRLSSGSGSDKLKIVGDDDERAQALLSLFEPPPTPEATDGALVLSNNYNPNLSLDEKLARYNKNPRRFVEFTTTKGVKKLYLLNNSRDADSVFAYDVDKLIENLKSSGISETDPGRKSQLGTLSNPIYSQAIRKSIAGTLSASRPIGAKNPTNWEIHGIEVKSSHRRRGLGSSMMKLHRDTFPELRLDHSKVLSDEGRAFSSAVPIERLASGVEKPIWPRRPTYGAFIDGADDVFGDAKTWSEFKEIYDNTEMIFLDYETTGLVFDEFRKPSSNGNPVQIGLVRMKGGKVIDSLNLFMNPEEQLGQWSLDNLKDLDGNLLTDKWLSSQMSIAEAHKKAIEFIGDKGILGVQNASFDKDVLEDALSNSGISWKPFGYIDTKEISDMVLPKWTPETDDGPFRMSKGNKVPSNGLADITKYLNVDLGDKHHYASADAEAAGMVMSAIVDGAITNGWSDDILSRDKRIAKMKANNSAFEKKLKQFEIDKSNFLTNTPSSERLSSGKNPDTRQRPIIRMSKGESEKIELHRQRKYKYGDKSVLHEGQEIRRNRNNWLEGLTTQQMADLLVPSSKLEQFEMWMDDFAPGAKDLPEVKKAFQKYWDEYTSSHPWDSINESPEAVDAIKNTIKTALDSNPNMRWAFGAHGAPMFALWDTDAINLYESRPEIMSRLDEITKSRGYKDRAFVMGRLSPFVDLALFHPRAVIDMVDSQGNTIPSSMGKTHMAIPGDNHIDASIAGKIMHEWGHWLHYRAIRDYENKTRNSNRLYYGSGNKNDPSYIAGLEIAQQYNSSAMNKDLMKLHEAGVDIDADKNAPRTVTSYAHVSPAEMMAEGVVAVLHPNEQMSNDTINAKLQKDVEILLGGDGMSFKPWETHSAKEIALSKKRLSQFTKNERKQRLSSGKIDALGRETIKTNASSPRFERKSTQGKYVSGRTPNSKTLGREMGTDWADIRNSEFSEFTFIDTFGEKQWMFTQGKGNPGANKFQMSLLIADSLDFEPDEFFEIFPQFKYDGASKFYINIANMPTVDTLLTENNQGFRPEAGLFFGPEIMEYPTTSMSQFYGLSPGKLFSEKTMSMRPDKFFVEFDANSDEGKQMMKAIIVNTFFDEWSMGTSRAASQSLIKAASSLFGTESTKEDFGIDDAGLTKTTKIQDSFARDILSSMYELTQSYFKSKNITHVNLFRGMKVDESELKEIGDASIKIDNVDQVSMSVTNGNPLGSWSSSLYIARLFSEAYGSTNNKFGITMKQIVPVEDIVGTYLFNFGVFGEDEFIILGKSRPTLIYENSRATNLTIDASETWTNESMDLFESYDDDKFYAYAKSLAKQLADSEDKSKQEISSIVNQFVDSQDESISRLSSGKKHKIINTLKNAFGFDIQPQRNKDDTSRSSRSPTKIAGPSLSNIVDDSLLTSDLFGRGIYDDVNKINAGSRNEDPSRSAKRAVAQMLSESSIEDAPTIGTVMFTRASLLALFDEKEANKINDLINSGDQSAIDFFGTAKFVDSDTATEAQFAQKMENEYGWMGVESWQDIMQMPDSAEDRAAYINELGLLKKLLKIIENPESATKESDFKFKVNLRDGTLLTGAEFIRALSNEQIEITTDKISSNLLKRFPIKDKTLRRFPVEAMDSPEALFENMENNELLKSVLEIFPETQNALNKLQELQASGDFGSQPSNTEGQTQIIVERLIHDILRMPLLKNQTLEPYRKQQVYDLFTKVGGMSDEDMTSIGFYDDENPRIFSQHAEKVIYSVFGGGATGDIVFTTDVSQLNELITDSARYSFGPKQLTVEAERGWESIDKANKPVRMSFVRNQSSQFEDGIAREPKLSEIEDIKTRSGAWSSDSDFIQQSEQLLANRRFSIKANIIAKLFPKKDESAPPERQLRIIEVRDKKGNSYFLFENAELPSAAGQLYPRKRVAGIEEYTGTAASLVEGSVDNRLNKQFEIVNSHILTIPKVDTGFFAEKQTMAAIDMFFTEQYAKQQFRNMTSSLISQLMRYVATPETLENNDYSSNQKLLQVIRSVANFKLSNPFEDTLLPFDRLETFDVRTERGQSQIKQRIMSELVKSWAESSNKTLTSALIQQVAGEMFDLTDTALIGDVIGRSNGATLFSALRDMVESGRKFKLSSAQKKTFKSMLGSMHEATQEYFRQKGITHLTVYRGLTLPDEDVSEDVREGLVDTVIAKSRPLSSWTTSLEIAEGFSGGSTSESGKAVVIGTVVPVNEILSVPITGFGCLSEDEVVVLGKPREVIIAPSKKLLRTTAYETDSDLLSGEAGSALTVEGYVSSLTSRVSFSSYGGESFPIPVFSTQQVTDILDRIENLHRLRARKGKTDKSYKIEKDKFQLYQQFLERLTADQNTSTISEIKLEEAMRVLKEFDDEIMTQKGTGQTLKFRFQSDSIQQVFKQRINDDYVIPLREKELSSETFEERLSSGISIDRKNRQIPPVQLEQLGNSRRVELRNHRNIERFRNRDESKNIEDDYFLFDSVDGLSVTVFSGNQLRNYTDSSRRKFPDNNQIREMVEAEKPVASMRIIGLKDDGSLNVGISVLDEHNIPGLAETMANFHNRHNTNNSGGKFQRRVEQRLSSGREPISVRTVTTSRKAYTNPTKSDMDMVKSATEKLNDTGLMVQQFRWTGKNGERYESPLFQAGDRAMVIVSVNGVNVPFYISSGGGGKKNVPKNQWYPIFGIDPITGWFNKTSEEDILDYYGVPEFRSIASLLNRTVKVGDLPKKFVKWNFGNKLTPESDGFVRNRDPLKPEIERAVNRDMKPIPMWGRENLQKNIDIVKALISSGRESDKAGYRKRRPIVESIVSDEKFIDSDNKQIREVQLSFFDQTKQQVFAEINSSIKNRDLYDLPPEKEVSIYLRNEEGFIIGTLHARTGHSSSGDIEADSKIVVSDVVVNEQKQRTGLGRAMLKLASKYNVDGEEVRHSTNLSPDGKLFAEGTPVSRTKSPSPRDIDRPRRLYSGASDDYKGQHEAPGRGSGAPLHDLISPDYSVYPEDVYSSNAISYYGVGDDSFDAMAFNLIKRFKNRPEAEITIYRAVPRSRAKQIEKLEKQIRRYQQYGKFPPNVPSSVKPRTSESNDWYVSVTDEIERLKNLPPNNAKISAGDWVTPFRQYAVDHGDGALRGEYEIVKKRVKAKHIYTEGNSWLEWGYDDSDGPLRLSSGNDGNRSEIYKLLGQKNISSISAGLRSIAYDYADYKYEMTSEMANSLLQTLRRLPDRPDTQELGLSPNKPKYNVSYYGENDEFMEVQSFEIGGDVFNVQRGGDSPARNAYNGYYVAFLDGENVAHLDYNSDSESRMSTIAMVSTQEKFRNRGIAKALLEIYLNENPDYDVSPGYTTEDGDKWWKAATGSSGSFRLSSKKNNRLSSGTIVPLNPDTSWPPPGENGYGAMPGDSTNRVVKMVPISKVRQYLEFDRTGKDGFGDESEKEIKKIEEELRSGRGINTALQLFTSIDDKWAYLGEGHHRLIAAERAGLTHVPVTVEMDKSNTRASDNKKKGIGAPLNLIHPKMWQREEKYNHLPGRATPGVFAELQDDEDKRLMTEWESNNNTDKWRISSEANRRLSSGNDTAKLRKVGPYRMKKHGKGHWESEDGFHFRQSSPPYNLWDVHENGDSYSRPIYESDTGNLQRAVAQFRNSQAQESPKRLSSGTDKTSVEDNTPAPKIPKKLFHGSTTRLNVGDYLLPPSETGVKPRALPDIDSSEFNNADYVYLTSNLEDAQGYGTDIAKPNQAIYIYEVEPSDDVEVDPENEYSGAEGGFRSRKAKIKKIVATPATRLSSGTDKTSVEELADSKSAKEAIQIISDVFDGGLIETIKSLRKKEDNPNSDRTGGLAGKYAQKINLNDKEDKVVNLNDKENKVIDSLVSAGSLVRKAIDAEQALLLESGADNDSREASAIQSRITKLEKGFKEARNGVLDVAKKSEEQQIKRRLALVQEIFGTSRSSITNSRGTGLIGFELLTSLVERLKDGQNLDVNPTKGLVIQTNWRRAGMGRVKRIKIDKRKQSNGWGGYEYIFVESPKMALLDDSEEMQQFQDNPALVQEIIETLNLASKYVSMSLGRASTDKEFYGTSTPRSGAWELNGLTSAVTMSDITKVLYANSIGKFEILDDTLWPEKPISTSEIDLEVKLANLDDDKVRKEFPDGIDFPPSDEIWVSSVFPRNANDIDHLSQPPHKFKVRMNPVSGLIEIELIEEGKPTNTDFEFNSTDKAMKELRGVVGLMAETTMGHYEKSKLFVETIDKALKSNKLRKLFADTSVTTDTDLTIIGDSDKEILYPSGTNAKTVFDAIEILGRRINKLQTKLDESRSNAQDSLVVRVLEKMGVEFPNPEEIPVSMVYFNSQVNESRFDKMMTSVDSPLDVGSEFPYNGDDRENTIKAIQRIASLIPKALVDGRLSDSLKDSGYDTGEGRWSIDEEKSKGGVLRLFHRVVLRVHRAHASNYGNGKALITQEPLGPGRSASAIRTWESTMLHESVHGAEYANPVLRVLEWMVWTKRRNESSQAWKTEIRKLKDITFGRRASAYQEHEVGVEDEWGQEYAGKIYGLGAPSDTFEILTTGMQGIFYPLRQHQEILKNPLGYKRTKHESTPDDDHLNFVLGVLLSTIKTPKQGSSPTRKPSQVPRIIPIVPLGETGDTQPRLSPSAEKRRNRRLGRGDGA